MIAARWIGLLTGALLLSVGCANAPATEVVPRASSEASETIAPDLPMIDWGNPLGTIEKSLDEAQSQLAFDPQPPNLGTPEAGRVRQGGVTPQRHPDHQLAATSSSLTSSANSPSITSSLAFASDSALM